MSYSRGQLNDWLKKIDISEKTVLDIGSGPIEKSITKMVRGKPKLLKTSDIDSTFKCDYTIDLNDEKIELPQFQYVFCIETIEHVWNPVQAIKNLSKITTEKLFLSAPFINPHHDKWDYFRITGEWFEFVLKKFGFSHVSITERVATLGLNLLKNFYTTEGLRISKIRPEFNHYTYPIGYCVEAKK